MIRLRIDRENDKPCSSGLVWYDSGKAVGRVIIEQEVVSEDHPPQIRWVPVEVVDVDLSVL